MEMESQREAVIVSHEQAARWSLAFGLFSRCAVPYELHQ